MSADIILRIFLRAKPLQPHQAWGFSTDQEGCQGVGGGQKHNAPPPPDPHETLTFRDGLKLCVIGQVTHFNPINTRQQKLNLLQDRQGWG